MIHVVAVMTAKPGLRAELLNANLATIDHVRSEPGCIEYGPAVDIEDAPDVVTPVGPDTFVVIEKWADRNALLAHSASNNYKDYAKHVSGLIASRIIHVLDPVQPVK